MHETTSLKKKKVLLAPYLTIRSALFVVALFKICLLESYKKKRFLFLNYEEKRRHKYINLRWTDIDSCLECTASTMFAYELWNGKLNDKPTILCVRW